MREGDASVFDALRHRQQRLDPQLAAAVGVAIAVDLAQRDVLVGADREKAGFRR